MYGIGIPWQRAQKDADWYDIALKALKPPWWYNWKWDLHPRPNYIPMIWRLTQSPPYGIIKDGDEWLVGNEPEREDQANQSPRDFASCMLHLRAQRLRTRFGLPGVLWSESGRLWIERYLECGGPKPDFWAIHIYAYTAREWSICASQARDYFGRLHDVPIAVTECGAWRVDDAISIMEAVGDALQQGIIQSAAQFSAYYDGWPEANLLTREGELTPLGRAYLDRKQVQAYLPFIRRDHG